MVAPLALCPLKLARLWLFSHNVKDWTRGVVNRAVSALRRSQARWLGLALSHDGLWVFANRILANRILADRVLADWRRRHRGRLLARQIGGSGNAQHGHEPRRYDYDRLHDANPLVLGTRTVRPSDAPIPLCLCKTPVSAIPRSGSIAGGMAPDYLSPRPVEWFKCEPRRRCRGSAGRHTPKRIGLPARRVGLAGRGIAG